MAASELDADEEAEKKGKKKKRKKAKEKESQGGALSPLGTDTWRNGSLAGSSPLTVVCCVVSRRVFLGMHVLLNTRYHTSD